MNSEEIKCKENIIVQRMGMINNKIIKVIFLLSGSVLSAILSSVNGVLYMGIGMLLSCIIYGVLLFKMKNPVEICRDSVWKIEVLAVIWSTVSVYICVSSMVPYVKKVILLYIEGDIKDSSICAVIAILIFPFIFMIYRSLILVLKEKVLKIYQNFTIEELMFFWIHIGVMTLLVLIIYQQTSAFSYAQFIDENGNMREQTANAILNTDSSSLLKKSCNLAYMGDVRHPVWIMLHLPLSSVAWIIAKVFPVFELMYPAVQCILINICLTYCIIFLARLIGSKWSLVLFGVSYPFLLYGLLFETSQMATCITLLVVYKICKNDKLEESTSFFVASAVGYTLTSCVLALFIEKASKLKQFVKEIIKSGIKFLSLCVICGQTYLVCHLWDEGMKMLTTYGGSNYSFQDRLIAFSHSMAAALVSVPYRNFKEPREQYHYFSYYLTVWNKEAKIEWFGLVVLMLVLLGFIWNYKNKYARICIIWLAYHFGIFVVLGYSAGDFTVHIMLYSWAIVSLIVMAVSRLLNRLKVVNTNLVWGIFSAIILCKNMKFLMDICQYAMERFPI